MLCNDFEVHYFHFSKPSKTKRSVIFASSQNKRKQTTSIFSTQQRFFRCFCWQQRSHRCFTGQTILCFCWLRYLSAASLDRTMVFTRSDLDGLPWPWPLTSIISADTVRWRRHKNCHSFFWQTNDNTNNVLNNYNIKSAAPELAWEWK